MSDSQSASPSDVALTQVLRIGKHFRLQWEEVQNAYVLLYPEGMVKLNESAGEILSRCNGEDSIEDIVTALANAFPDAERGDIESDVLGFFADALVQRWVYCE